MMPQPMPMESFNAAGAPGSYATKDENLDVPTFIRRQAD
jgi:hypothetical protein